MSSKAIIDYTMEDDSLGVRDALYSAIQDRVMAHIEAKKAEIASNFITQQEEVEELDELSLETMKSAREKLKSKAFDAHYNDNKYAAQHYAARAVQMGTKIKRKGRSALPPVKEEFAEYTTEEIENFLESEEFEQLDEIDRNALYHRLQGSIAAKNKAYSFDNAREFSGGKLRDAGEKKASLANHVAGIRKAQSTLGKLTSSNPRNSVIKPQAEEYVNIPEGVEVFVPTNSINEASKEEHPWRMDKDRKGTGYHIVNSVRPKMAKVNGIHKTIGLEHDGVHSHAFESHHEAEKAAYDLAERGHTCTHHCPQGYVKAVVQPSHSFEI
jgi:hypothetical protein